MNNNQDNYSISDSLNNVLDKVVGFIPNILGVLALLLIGWILARIVKKLTVSILRRLRFDRSISQSPAGNTITRVIEHPTSFVGSVAYWIVFLAFASFAISALGVPALTLIVNGVYAYIPNVIAAVIIFLVASAITVGAEAFVLKVLAPGALAKLLSAVVPALIMPLAIFMILNQLRIAPEIVNITYTALIGSVALGLALAFGLGGRDVAARILEQTYSKVQDNSDELKREMKQAKRDTQNKVQDLR